MVQATHAAIELLRRSEEHCDEHPHLVILAVPDLDQLLAAQSRLAKCIRTTPYYEPDLDNQLTALAAGPLYDSDRVFFRHYKLWRQPSC